MQAPRPCSGGCIRRERRAETPGAAPAFGFTPSLNPAPPYYGRLTWRPRVERANFFTLAGLPR
jgi:hypothetical protein